MGVAAVGAVATIGAAAISSSSTSSASHSQARALRRSERELAAAKEEAKAEILDRMVPALADYRTGISQAQDQIANGSFNVINTLKQYTTNADQILSQAGIDAQKAIMGSNAVASGIPASQFNAAYSTAQNAPASARNTMMQQLQSAFSSPGGTNAAGSVNRQISPVGGNVMLNQPAATPGVATAAQQPSTLAANAQQATPSAVMPSAATIPASGPGYTSALGTLQSGYTTAQNALTQGTAQARQDVLGSTNNALNLLSQTKAEGLGQLQPYTDAGTQAMQREAALSGALGPEAQQQAINAYIESPGQAYLRQQQEKALLRNQAAIGGLGGGNVLSALQQQAMNIASTQQQQYLENLRSIATRGQEAATTGTGLISQTGLAGASLQAGVGNTLAQLAQQYGISSANLAQMSAEQIASLSERTGINLANLQQATAAARASLQTQLGSGIAGAQASAATDIAGLTQTGATNALNTNQNISNTLANLAVNTGTNTANLEAAAGGSLAAGQYLQGQAWAQGLSGLGDIAMYYGNQNVNPNVSGGLTISPYEVAAAQANPWGQSMNTDTSGKPYF